MKKGKIFAVPDNKAGREGNCNMCLDNLSALPSSCCNFCPRENALKKAQERK
jgi:hypothetical protein